MENLRQLRKSFKMSQRQLAEVFGVSQSQIQSYEKGAYEPDIKTMKLMAEFFNTSVDYLIGNADIKRKIRPATEYYLSMEEKDFVDTFRNLRPNQRRCLLLFLDALQGNEQ